MWSPMHQSKKYNYHTQAFKKVKRVAAPARNQTPVIQPIRSHSAIMAQLLSTFNLKTMKIKYVLLL
jgi:L-lysine 2,3-aminomutase